MACPAWRPIHLPQGFVNASFENITSTEHALSLLAQFQAIMQRETLKQDLETKYMVIFQNYAKDLDAVQKLYEKNKYEPPVPRNAPPVAGNIMWARQLLRRIEAPMQRFAQNKNLLAAKESKKIIKTYNKVGRQGCVVGIGRVCPAILHGSTLHVPYLSQPLLSSISLWTVKRPSVAIRPIYRAVHLGPWKGSLWQSTMCAVPCITGRVPLSS